VPFYFFDDVLLLYLALEAAKRIFEGFALLNSNFRQKNYTPLLALTGPVSYGKPPPASQAECKKIALSFQKRKRSESCIWRGAYALMARMKLVGC
jgi:hypothetical protein